MSKLWNIKLVSAIIAVFLALPVLAATKPDISSPSVVVISWQDGRTLFERDAETVRPIASISKMFAALVLDEECKLDSEMLYQVPSRNMNLGPHDGKSLLNPGWRYSISDLLHAVLLISDNRALNGLADACGLSPKALGERMTLRAQNLGLRHTRFEEPTGLSPQNVSTAREVASMLRAVTMRPRLRLITTKRHHVITAYPPGGRRILNKIHNTDTLVENEEIHVISGKTGFTNFARYCLAVAVKTLSHGDLGIVLLGAEGRVTRFADVERIYRWLDGDRNP